MARKEDRQQNKQKILNFLIRKGADKFWANSALRHIMLNFAGNTYWLTEIRNLKVIIGQFGMVDKFTMTCTINAENGAVPGKFIYTHDSGHKVRICSAYLKQIS